MNQNLRRTCRLAVAAFLTPLGGAFAQQLITKDLSNSQDPPGNGDFITWIVQGTGWQVGQFVNGDWWIAVGSGTVTVTGVTVSGNVPYEFVPNAITVGSQQLPKVRSGSMKNPRSAKANAASGYPNGYQNIYYGTPWANEYGGLPTVLNSGFPLGYDSRSGDFFPDFSVQLPVTLQAWDVLVTTISQPEAGPLGLRPDYYPPAKTLIGDGWWTLFGGLHDPAHGLFNAYARSPTRLASVLTVLPEPPASPCLRPPYCGTPQERATRSGGVYTGSQPATYMQPWAWNPTVMMARTPSVARPPGVQSANTTGTIGTYGLLDFWVGTWIDHLQGENCPTFCAPGDAVPTYGGDQNFLLGQTALMLCEAPNVQMSSTEKETLTTRFLQFGIDTYGVVQDGKRFVGTGGHNGGRKWPVVYAGIVLGNADLHAQPLQVQDPPVSGPLKPVFKEDAQCMVTYLPSTTPPLFQWDWQGLFYRWRDNEETDVTYQDRYPSTPGNNWSYSNCRSENYRVCCTLQGYLYVDLAARLMSSSSAAGSWGKDVMHAWQNDAFFGCVDRFMMPMTPEACAEYDYMQETIQATQAPWDETITGHWSGWGQSKAVAGPSNYGELMWRALRWSYHQRGVDWIRPGTFHGQEVLCQYGPQLEHMRCRTPCERAIASSGCPNPIYQDAPRYFPTLVCEQEPRVDPVDPIPMHFEVYDVPPESWITVYLAGNELPSAPQFNPTMNCTCTPSTPVLCGAPLLVDNTQSVLGFVSGGSASFGNLNFALVLPPAVSGSFAVQAVCLPYNLGDLTQFYTTNSYAFTTFQ